MKKYAINLFKSRQITREKIELVHPIGVSYTLIECPADHSVYHSTLYVEDLISILEKGIKTPVDSPRVQGICKGVPAAFFSGYPDEYGNLFVATHTRDSFGRPMFLNEDSSYGPIRQGRSHPCNLAGRYEEKSLRHRLNQEEIGQYMVSLERMRSDVLQHVILGQYKNEFVKPRDGFGVGITGQNIETDPLAEELARRNIPFKYLKVGTSGFEDRYFTYRDFPTPE